MLSGCGMVEFVLTAWVSISLVFCLALVRAAARKCLRESGTTTQVHSAPEAPGTNTADHRRRPQAVLSTVS